MNPFMNLSGRSNQRDYRNRNNNRNNNMNSNRAINIQNSNTQRNVVQEGTIHNSNTQENRVQGNGVQSSNAQRNRIQSNGNNSNQSFHRQDNSIQSNIVVEKNVKNMEENRLDSLESNQSQKINFQNNRQRNRFHMENLQSKASENENILGQSDDIVNSKVVMEHKEVDTKEVVTEERVEVLDQIKVEENVLKSKSSTENNQGNIDRRRSFGFNRNNYDRNNSRRQQNLDVEEVIVKEKAVLTHDIDDKISLSTVDVIEKLDKEESRVKYRADLPYPPLCVKEENHDYAKLLLEDYASAGSELTAICSYVYQNITTDEEFCDIKEAYMGIAKVEMMHLNMLGQLIFLLGIDPGFYYKDNGRLIMWNGDYVKYQNCPRCTIKHSIEGEIAAINQYQRHADIICDENVSAVLLRIKQDEEVHVKILTELHETYFKC